MALPGNVVSAADMLHGVDTAARISGNAAQKMLALGFGFCIRYLSRSTPQQPGDLTTAEANGILRAGLALMPVQHVASPGWMPKADLGTNNGKAAVANAQAVGFPKGVNVWFDLEGVSPAAQADDVIAHCNAWFAEVTGAGYVPGVYVGANAILTGDDLFFRLATKHYWKSGSNVPDIPHRGYQMIQRITADKDVVAGVGVDRNIIKADLSGTTPLMLAP